MDQAEQNAAVRKFIESKVDQLLLNLEIHKISKLVVPTFLAFCSTTEKSSAQMGIYELYCCDNEHFIDTLLTFGTPLCIQQVIHHVNLSQRTQAALFSPKYMMKIISLVFNDNLSSNGSRTKPYIYQVHLMQVFRAASRQIMKKQENAGREIIVNALFALEHQFKRIGQNSAS